MDADMLVAADKDNRGSDGRSVSPVTMASSPDAADRH